MSETEPQQGAPRPGRTLAIPTPGSRRVTVIGAGSFGTALAVLLVRGGVRTTLQTRTEEQAVALSERRTNETYLPGVELPPQLRIEHVSSGIPRVDYVFLAVPSTGLGAAIDALDAGGLGRPLIALATRGVPGLGQGQLDLRPLLFLLPSLAALDLFDDESVKHRTLP